MAKASLRKPESDAAWRVIGQAMDHTRLACRLSVKEFADRLGRDEAQVRRWFLGKERPQADVVFAIADFQQPFVIALAGFAGAGVTLETVIRVQRGA